MLNGLVLTDGPVKHDPVLGILRGAAQGVLTNADGFGPDQDPLRIEAMQDIAKALALFADPVLVGDE